MTQIQSDISSIDASLIPFYEKALLIRLTELTLLALFKQGKIFGTVHTCIGQKFTFISIS